MEHKANPHTPEASNGKLALPSNVVTVTDLARVIRELDGVDNFLSQSVIRQPGTNVALPKVSKMLEDVAKLNNINLLDEVSREQFSKQIKLLHDEAPRVHISFAASPTASFTQKIIEWFRRETDPCILLQVGLQPTIAAGCALRTPNKYFDFSLRKHLQAQQKLLIQKIHDASEAPSQ